MEDGAGSEGVSMGACPKRWSRSETRSGSLRGSVCRRARGCGCPGEAKARPRWFWEDRAYTRLARVGWDLGDEEGHPERRRSECNEWGLRGKP